MSTNQGTVIEILGKSYQIKCPEEEIVSLKQAAKELEEKMNQLRETGQFNFEKLAVIIALNLTHQNLSLQSHIEQHKHEEIKKVTHCLLDLEQKIDDALGPLKQLELYPAEQP